MKITFRHLILVLCGLLMFAGKSYAAGVPITGTAYGEKIGLLHFDYTTARNPNPGDAQFNDPAYYIGPTKQFYISPYDDSGAFTGSGDPAVTAYISTEVEDCTVSGCLLRGFIWSDAIGWIALDGPVINTAVFDATGLPDDDSMADPYRDEMYPRIRETGAITGYAWNEYTGWINFSRDDILGTIQENQHINDWGAWLDIVGDVEAVVTDPGPPEIQESIGRHFYGYVWSENLGWIKFGKEAADTFDFDFGALTKWVPDDTAPVILSPNLAWFAVGVNTGDAPSPFTIEWGDETHNFVEDPESGINNTGTGDLNSIVNIEKTDDADVQCPKPPPLYPPLGNAILSAAWDDVLHKEIVILTIPTVGNLMQVPTGFCKYKLTAKIANNSNIPLYIGDTFLPVAPETPHPDSIQMDEIIFYVRAGDYDENESEVDFAKWPDDTPHDGAAVADGNDFVEYTVYLKDLAENPIMDIDCSSGDVAAQFQYPGCPGREVTVTTQITNELVYDLTEIGGVPSSPYPTPVKHNDVNVSGGGEYLLDNDAGFEVNKPNFDFYYQVEIASYAPNSTYTPISLYQNSENKEFTINSFDYLIVNDALPATILDPATGNPDPTTETDAYNDPGIPDAAGTDTAPITFVPGIGSLTFVAPVSTKYPVFVGIEPLNIATITGDLNLQFKINNISSLPINLAEEGDGGLAIDNIIQYYSDTYSTTLAVMDTQRVKDIDSEEDTTWGWFDPFNITTRYEMFHGKRDDIYADGLDLSADNSVFRFVYPFYFDDMLLYEDIEQSYIDSNPDMPDAVIGISNAGEYYLSGMEGIPESHDVPIDPDGDLDDSYNYPPSIIDRSEDIIMNLPATADPAAPESDPGQLDKEIQFTPEKISTITIDDIELQVIQEIAYRFADQPLFTIYAQSPLVSGMSVKDIGFEAIGTVAGEEIVTGRKFDVVGTASTRKLQEQIRRSAAQLTAGIDTDNCIFTANTILDHFETPTDAAKPNCIIEDNVNGTIFAYYEGDSAVNLILNNEGGGLTAPDQPYTIILKGGANLFIKDNILYPVGATNASLGIIIIAEQIGDGANVYIDPAPTNIVGTLYAEGSVLSRSTDSAFYYGVNGGSVNDLKNQLYWLGSIASRNTIAGAGQEQAPEGIICEAGDTPLSCAQRYDFDYLRRFTAINKKDEFGTVIDSYINNDGYFSGGGICIAGTCTDGTLPSVVTLVGGHFDEDESELSPFFIKQDPRTINNPPPGFTIAGGFESIQEIR